MKSRNFFYMALFFVFFLQQSSFSHCEVPCGIYNDDARLEDISENIATIEKAIKSMVELSSEKEKNNHQIIRWIINKEKHAEKIQEITYQYFMTQRIKPVDKEDKKNFEAYQSQLTLAHHLLVYAMKCKQSMDLQNVEKLKSILSDFHKSFHDHK